MTDASDVPKYNNRNNEAFIIYKVDSRYTAACLYRRYVREENEKVKISVMTVGKGSF